MWGQFGFDLRWNPALLRKLARQCSSLHLPVSADFWNSMAMLCNLYVTWAALSLLYVCVIINVCKCVNHFLYSFTFIIAILTFINNCPHSTASSDLVGILFSIDAKIKREWQ